MTRKLEIRERRPGDATEIEQLYVDAFPDEDLLPLIGDLLNCDQQVFSLVAISENAIVGHISFTYCLVEGSKSKVSLLGPLAVTPTFHKQGIGSALVQVGFKHLKNSNNGYVFVLGDPAYYIRFGFKAEDKVMTPYPLPPEWQDAWQSVSLDDSQAPPQGRLSVPEPWRHISLWAC